MVRKTRQKRKAKIKKIPKSSGRGDDSQLIVPDASVQSSDIQKSADSLESEENAAETAETSDYSTEMTKFSCAVSCKTELIAALCIVHF